VRILTEPEASLIKQYIALMGVEDVTLHFAEDAIGVIADIAAEVNQSVENIGARRLHTILEKLMDEISFTASERSGEEITIDAAHVHDAVDDLAKNADLKKFIL
jgi:ATP-dependent HslUV protease ATP-binding subunit HslU